MTDAVIPPTASKSWFWRAPPTADTASTTTPGRTNHLKSAEFSSATTAESRRTAGASSAYGRKNLRLRPKRKQRPSPRKVKNQKRRSRSRAERSLKLEPLTLQCRCEPSEIRLDIGPSRSTQRN